MPRALSQNIWLLDLIVTWMSEIVLHLESQNRFTDEMYLHDNLHNFVYFVGVWLFCLFVSFFVIHTSKLFIRIFKKETELIIEWNKGLYKDLRKNLRRFFKVNSWLERKKKKAITFLASPKEFCWSAVHCFRWKTKGKSSGDAKPPAE